MIVAHDTPAVSPLLSTGNSGQTLDRFTEPAEFVALAERVAARSGRARHELGATQLVEAMTPTEREAAAAYLVGVCELAWNLGDLNLHYWGTQRLSDVREAMARAVMRERRACPRRMRGSRASAS